jgi:ubiquinone/menaquinone biosynthesis C-methylase UbiE
MSSYVGRHAELYDIFYSDKEYDKEAAFVNQCIRRFGEKPVKNILELACGTGSHALELEKFGYKITATDYSEDMLNSARKKAESRSSSIVFEKQDMRNLEKPEVPFDVVICLFDSIGYVITNDALNQVFQGVYRQLREKGLFVFEFWHAAAMLRKYDPLRVRKWYSLNGEICRISETTLDIIRQVSKVKYSIFELNNAGTYSRIEEIQENRYFLIQEMNMWLKQNNFELVKIFAGFEEDETITEDTWHILVVARRN